MADERIRVDFEGPMAIVTVARPEKLNAFDIDMLKALDSACDTVEAKRDVRAVILTGEGKAFRRRRHQGLGRNGASRLRP